MQFFRVFCLVMLRATGIENMVRLVKPWFYLLLFVAYFAGSILCDEITKNDMDDDDDRVKGGEPIEPHSRPYIAYLAKQATEGRILTVGAIIIDPYTLLTTYQLNTPGGDEPTHVAAGKHKSLIYEPTQQVREVCKFSRHGAYNGGGNAYTSVHLSDPLTFNEYVQAIPLAPKGFWPNGTCTLIGWGATAVNPAFRDVPHQKAITVYSDLKKCQKPNHETLICGSAGACGKHWNEFGGALVCQDEGRIIAFGIGASDECDKPMLFSSIPNIPQDFKVNMTAARNQCYIEKH